MAVPLPTDFIVAAIRTAASAASTSVVTPADLQSLAEAVRQDQSEGCLSARLEILAGTLLLALGFDQQATIGDILNEINRNVT